MKKTLLTFVLTISSIIVFSQSIDINWSDLQEYDNKKDGFFKSFIGGNSKYIFAKYTKMAMTESKMNSKIKIVAYDKNSMNQENQVAICGYEENKSDELLMKDLDYFDQIVF